MSTPVADTDARTAALDISRSFCVQAPAGSGKTELLTQRILRLLAHCERPEEILAFTFTRKAAAEMRERLLEALQIAARTSETEMATLTGHKRLTLSLAKAVLARDAAQDWQLLGNSRRLRINTIDSFTQYLTTQLPLSASFGARPEVADDIDRIFARAIRSTLAHVERESPAAPLVEQLLLHLHGDLGRAESLLLNLLEKRDQWLPLVVALRHNPDDARNLLEANLRDMLEDTLRSARTQLLPLQGRLMSLLAFAAENLAQQGETALRDCNFGTTLPDAASSSVGAWRELASLFLKSDRKEFLSKPDARHGFPSDKARKQLCDDMKAEFRDVVAQFAADDRLPMLQHLAVLPDAAYSAAQWEMLAALTALLPLLAAELEVAMRHAARIDHTQTSLAALQALGNDDNPTDLALRLDYRIRHILVDEFQDTSSLQFHLLEKLTAGWQPGDGRTLFIVGDGMQSCYAFRNANVGLFLRARDEGIGPVKLESLMLSVNFRSEQGIIEWVNTVFTHAFPLHDDITHGGVRYSPSVSRPGSAAGSGVRCRLWTHERDDNNGKESRRAREAAEVAALCLRLQQEQPQQSVAILVRTRTHLDAIVPALRAAGLRWSASEVDPLLSYPEIGDLYSLLRALLNLADVSAWFAVLRAPFVGLPLADLELLAAHARTQQTSLWSALQAHGDLALSTEARARLGRTLPLLQAARELRGSMPPRELLQRSWIALGGPACISDPGMLPNVTAFLDLVELHTEHGDIPDIHYFEKQLDKCHGSADHPGVTLQIMTIHKAKGLEFDHVIVPGLDRESQSDRNELLIWKEWLDASNASRPLLAVLHSKGDREEPLYHYLRFDANLRKRLELTRLCYIAVTRAARSAWLFGFVRSGAKGMQPNAGSLLDSLWPAFAALPDMPGLQIEALPEVNAAPDTERVRRTTQTLHRLPANWQLPPALSELLTQAQGNATTNPSIPGRLAARIGELVHLGVQQLAVQGPAWLERAEQMPLWQRELLPFCANATELQQAVATVLRHLRLCRQAPEAEWLLFTPHHDAASELALCDYRNGLRRDFVVDRTFVDAAGLRWIIDYKSSMPGPQQERAAFFAEQAALYRPQLQTYAGLLDSRDPRPHRLALFFTGLPAMHVLE